MAEDTYQAVKAANRSYGAFLKDVAEEIGWNKVLQIRHKVGTRNGEASVQLFKQHPPETRLSVFGKQSSNWYNKSGWVMYSNASETELEAHIQTLSYF